MKENDEIEKMIPPTSDKITPPTPIAIKLVRYIVGFGVGVGIGLAPYLGVYNIPFFKPMLSLIPDSIRDTIIPLSAALMGMLAVVVQWYGGERVKREWLRKWFFRTLATAFVAFVFLTIVHSLVVVAIPIEDDDKLTFLVGFSRPASCSCPANASNQECIKTYIGSAPDKISSCWGDQQIQLATLSLMFLYLIFTSSFGWMVGLIVLKETQFLSRPKEN